LTVAQARALDTLRGHYCVASIDEIDGTNLGVEIGFGMGRELMAWAREVPERQLVGLELYEPGVGSLLAGLDRDGLTNVAVMEVPAQEALAELPDAIVDEVRIFFPDPWPKKRHHKRRLIQTEFVSLLARIIAEGGIVRIATDWAPYGAWIRQVFAEEPSFLLVLDSVRPPLATSPVNAGAIDAARSVTKFEARGEKLGHEIHDLIYRRVARA
jgi:tRNA (guanine-N7-)-methyltransferase